CRVSSTCHPAESPSAMSASFALRRRLDVRFTGIGGRGARLLLAAGAGLDHLGINGGVPRRMRRLAPRSAGAPHEDISAIVSVYR
ncbi:hypothetical protein AB0C31_51980, partial [Actinoplanes philippinensis]